MATIEGPCPERGRQTTTSVGVFAAGAEPCWFQDWRCAGCGLVMHVDYGGEPPEEVREAVLREDGIWMLTLARPETIGVPQLKALRQILRLSLAETAALRTQLAEPMASGAQAQMVCLQRSLAAEGIDSVLQSKPPAPLET